jgi:hypothetical protein
VPIAHAARACRSCGSSELEHVLDLGVIPLVRSRSDATRDAGRAPARPLVLVFCAECALVQTLPGVPVQEPLDGDPCEPPPVAEQRAFLELVSSRPLGPRSLVVEIGSGDGSLLRAVAATGIAVLGVERSTGAALSASTAGVPTLTEPFDRELATTLRAGGLDADVILASCVIDAVEGLNRFVEGLRILVADRGAIVLDTPYVFDILDRLAVGAVRHDRRSYFSCTSLDALIRRHGLFLNDAELHDDQASTRLRCLVEPRESMSERCAALLAGEAARRGAEASCYAHWQGRTRAVLDQLTAMLRSLRADGHTVAASGADADTVTVLNAGRVGPELISYVVERDPLARGMQLAGVDVPIVAPEVLRRARPDFLLVPRSARPDVRDADERAFLAGGGRYIVLQPGPRIVGTGC